MPLFKFCAFAGAAGAFIDRLAAAKEDPSPRNRALAAGAALLALLTGYFFLEGYLL